jgi:hypothetical protein
MDLSKPQEHNMNALKIYLFLMLSRSIKLILLFSLRLAMVICLYAKYIDDIIFGRTNQKSCEEFSRVMTPKFQLSMMGELTYFLRFQVKQLKEGTFFSQTKYIQYILKKLGMKDAKPAKTPTGTDGHLDLNAGGKSVDQKVYMILCFMFAYVLDFNLIPRNVTLWL